MIEFKSINIGGKPASGEEAAVVTAKKIQFKQVKMCNWHPSQIS